MLVFTYTNKIAISYSYCVGWKQQLILNSPKNQNNINNFLRKKTNKKNDVNSCTVFANIGGVVGSRQHVAIKSIIQTSRGFPRQLLDFSPLISNNNPMVFEMVWLYIRTYFCAGIFSCVSNGSLKYKDDQVLLIAMYFLWKSCELCGYMKS